MTKTDFVEILDALEKRLATQLYTCAELAAMKVVETHYKYCEEQRTKKVKTIFAVVGLLLTAAGVAVATI